MITTLFAWTVMFLVIFSIGDIFVSLYNRICRNKESYNLLDTFILGICFISILLPFSSLWFPSNEYVLFAYILVSVIYWYINIKRLLQYISKIKDTIRSFNLKEKVLIIVPVIAVLIYVYIFDHHYDAEYYHYQQIRWNEEFSIVPGLGNLEDRFAFNSNYLLLSAIFTFRFLFGNHEAVYLLQSLFYTLLFTWGLIKLFSSRYDLNYLILVIFLLLLIYIYGFMLGSSATDIFPILFVLYYAIKTAETPRWIHQYPLLACLLPVVLVTFKLSTAPFCIISLIVMINLIKEQKHRTLYFIIILSFLTILFWCIRNIIISGYLVYPVYQIDLFSFDWKMPVGTVEKQSRHISEWGNRIFRTDLNTFQNFISGKDFSTTALNCFINFTLLFSVIFSAFIITYKAIRKKINPSLFSVYLITLLCLIFSLSTAPDFRFNYGYILGSLLLSINILTESRVVQFPRCGKFVLIFILCCLCIVSTYKFITASKRIGMKFETMIDFVALYHHRSSKNIGNFQEYKMGNQTIYVTVDESDSRSFDLLPAVSKGGFPFSRSFKLQDIRTIEMRGNTLQEGFRTKEKYLEILNSEQNKNLIIPKFE